MFITADITSVTARLGRGIQFLQAPAPAVRMAARLALADSVASISQTHSDPWTGRKWAPWEENTRYQENAGAMLFRTGKLFSRIRIRGMTAFSAKVGTAGVDYASYMAGGTKAHDISAKRGSLLWFRTKRHDVMIQMVHHPGTPARRFIGIKRDSVKKVSTFMAMMALGG